VIPVGGYKLKPVAARGPLLYSVLIIILHLIGLRRVVT